MANLRKHTKSKEPIQKTIYYDSTDMKGSEKVSPETENKLVVAGGWGVGGGGWNEGATVSMGTIILYG